MVVCLLFDVEQFVCAGNLRVDIESFTVPGTANADITFGISGKCIAQGLENGLKLRFFNLGTRNDEFVAADTENRKRLGIPQNVSGTDNN